MAKLARAREPDPPQVPRKWLIALAVLAVGLLLLDFTGLRYGYFAYESAFGGWALTAFAAAFLALVAAALLRPLLVRRDDLYGLDDD